MNYDNFNRVRKLKTSQIKPYSTLFGHFMVIMGASNVFYKKRFKLDQGQNLSSTDY